MTTEETNEMKVRVFDLREIYGKKVDELKVLETEIALLINQINGVAIPPEGIKGHKLPPVPPTTE